MAGVVCWNCGCSLKDIPRPISRHANCPECFEDLHCCRLCVHFAPRLTAQCDDDRADPPIQKENANFCEFFRPLLDAYEDARGSRRDSARQRLDSLFGGDAGETPADSANAVTSSEDKARAELEALFKIDRDDADARSPDEQ